MYHYQIYCHTNQVAIASSCIYNTLLSFFTVNEVDPIVNTAKCILSNLMKIHYFWLLQQNTVFVIVTTVTNIHMTVTCLLLLKVQVDYC